MYEIFNMNRNRYCRVQCVVYALGRKYMHEYVMAILIAAPVRSNTGVVKYSIKKIVKTDFLLNMRH